MSFFRLILCSLLVTTSISAVETSHRVVYHNPAEFAGWPANEGLWSWGDNEMLVAFEVAKFVETEGDHNIDRNSPKRIAFARSLDGGETWTPEEHPQIASPEYLGDADKFVQEIVTAHDPRPSPGGFDFSHPNFAMKLRGGTFYVSHNRGRSWEGPYLLTEFDFIPEARTSYIITGPSSATIFMTGRVTKDGLKYGRSCVLHTTDGGKTFQFASWIGEDIADRLKPEERQRGFETIFSIMPSAVWLGGDRYICAVRQRTNRAKWTDIFETTDGGHTWTKLGTLERGSSNPATLVLMEDGAIAAVYGNRRRAPCGVAAKISRDQGRTWTEEIVLRNDARQWDIGYSRALQRPDGKIVALYYYTTEAMPENFIAATIWDASASR